MDQLILIAQHRCIWAALGFIVGMSFGAAATFRAAMKVSDAWARKVVDAFKSEIEWEAETVSADA